tara:strand:- start:363 stop:1154 length:792 start_codon:yes stop_codon:yes gene_type:complete
MWLTKVLNQHDEIFCSYSVDMDPQVTTDHLSTKEHNIALHEMGDEFNKLTIDQYFDILDERPGSLIGSVHAYALWQVAEQSQAFRRKYAIANLVREPISRLQSGINQMIYEMKFNENAAQGYEAAFLRNLDFAYPIEREFGVQFDEVEDRLFLNAVLSMAIDTRNLAIDAWHVRMEDLVSELSFLRLFINFIGDGIITANPEFLARIIQQKAPNSRAMVPQSPAQIFSSWPLWRQNFCIRLMRKLGLEERYESLGYNLSYLKK